MTPDDWDKCREAQRMLEFLRESGRASERKLRLFTCACCRRIWPLLTVSQCRNAVEVAERFADCGANAVVLVVLERIGQWLDDQLRIGLDLHAAGKQHRATASGRRAPARR